MRASIALIALTAFGAGFVAAAEPGSASEDEAVRTTRLAGKLDHLSEATPIAEVRTIVSEVRSLTAENDGPGLDEAGRTAFRLVVKLSAKIDGMDDPRLLAGPAPSRNLAPPGGAYPSGVAPDAIKDRQARAQYERVLRENATRIKTFERQRHLAKSKRVLLDQAAEFVRRHPEQDRFYETAIREEVGDEAFRKQLREKLFPEIEPKKE